MSHKDNAQSSHKLVISLLLISSEVETASEHYFSCRVHGTELKGKGDSPTEAQDDVIAQVKKLVKEKTGFYPAG